VGDFLKPDVTAPGIQILAGTSPAGVSVFSGPNGENFQAIAGTSMSSPHSAGVAALVRAAHPDWTPGQVRSAMMTSSVQDVTDFDGRTPATPFEMGAGSIRANRAVEPTLTFDESPEDFTLLGPDPIGMLDLNLASVDVPVMPGLVTVHRTATNVSGHQQTFDVATESDTGSIDVSPSAFTLASGASIALEVTIHAESSKPGQYFGRVWLVPRSGATTVTLPVAFVRTQGEVALTHTCSPTQLAVGESTNCEVLIENFGPVDSSVALEVVGPKKSQLDIGSVSDPGVESGNAVTFSGSLAKGLPPDIVSLTPGGSPAGYLPLVDFGVAPLEGLGDEDIVVFDVPSYLFGSEEYTQVSLTTDGYAIVGGGGSADVTFIPQDLPDPSRPNNVIAPFWTDTNLDFGGDVLAAELTDGVDSWIVLEYAEVGMWEVADTVSFQIWIKEGPSESVTFAYGPTSGSGVPSSGLVVGAENREGSSAVQLDVVPTTGQDYTVVAGAPTVGGSASITYEATAGAPGVFRLTAELESDVTVGTTTVVRKIRVG
jgi:hypothetical protein